MSELLIRFHVVHYIIRITDPGKHRFKKTIRNTIIILVNNLKFVTEFVTTWYTRNACWWPLLQCCRLCCACLRQDVLELLII